jgi:hypothetical protein
MCSILLLRRNYGHVVMQMTRCQGGLFHLVTAAARPGAGTAGARLVSCCVCVCTKQVGCHRLASGVIISMVRGIRVCYGN